MNKEWHDAHKMPKNVSLDDRIRWRIDHSKKCGCRPIPKSLLAEIKKRKNSMITPNSITSINACIDW